MKELSNVYGDVILTKHVSYENPCKIGEENVLLGINNAFTFIARDFVPVISLDQSEFFKLMMEAGL